MQSDLSSFQLLVIFIYSGSVVILEIHAVNNHVQKLCFIQVIECFACFKNFRLLNTVTVL
jgi:hypothetical protein